jgi:hypothetical protein
MGDSAADMKRHPDIYMLDICQRDPLEPSKWHPQLFSTRHISVLCFIYHVDDQFRVSASRIKSLLEVLLLNRDPMRPHTRLPHDKGFKRVARWSVTYELVNKQHEKGMTQLKCSYDQCHVLIRFGSSNPSWTGYGCSMFRLQSSESISLARQYPARHVPKLQERK